MTTCPFKILEDINKKKDNFENYYHNLSILLSSSQNQAPAIKYQIYYILGKEYYHFKEFEKSLNFFKLVFNNRDKFVVYNILEDTVLHLLNFDENRLFRTFITLEDTEYYCKCDISYFLPYLKNPEYAVHFLTDKFVDTFIDKLMVSNYYTENLKNQLLKFNNINVFLYLDLHNKDKYTIKIQSFNDQYSVDLFNMKYNLEHAFDENSLYYLYKKKRYSQIIKIDNKNFDNFDNNKLDNILYYSYYKLNLMDKASFYYDKVREILYPVDEIEYLHFLGNTTSVINKVLLLKSPTEFLQSLEIFYKKNDFELLRECIIVNIYKFEDINVFKVLISYLLLGKLDLKLIQDYKSLDFISDSDKDWLYKVVYNSIIDDIENNKEFVCLLNKLRDPCLDTVYISLITNTYYSYKDFLDICTEDIINSDLYFTILTLFYEINEDKEILIKLDITQRSNTQILSLLEVSSNKDIILEAHKRNILNSEILERGIIVNSIKGKLYSFLKSIYIIGIGRYLSYNSKIILKKEMEILEMYGDYKVVEFYNTLIE